MRGEHRLLKQKHRPNKGSSPHARGARTNNVKAYTDQGIIPACAGSTILAPFDVKLARDHPRMRGEHARRPTTWPSGPGSSPHARGALGCGYDTVEELRIIPACAGSTGRNHLQRQRPGDHPRMRGEHMDICRHGEIMQGSSPHARGALASCSAIRWCRGIIPACAGSTSQKCIRHSHGEDHPRMRGEHFDEDCGDFEEPGSSPHARGAPRCPSLCSLRPGIIPACAGSTVFTKYGITQGWGSSPHARGAPDQFPEIVRQLGIIPACAGSTRRFSAFIWIARDHPRMRGEHRHQRPQLVLLRGSSPHARGAL